MSGIIIHEAHEMEASTATRYRVCSCCCGSLNGHMGYFRIKFPSHKEHTHRRCLPCDLRCSCFIQESTENAAVIRSAFIQLSKFGCSWSLRKRRNELQPVIGAQLKTPLECLRAQMIVAQPGVVRVWNVFSIFRASIRRRLRCAIVFGEPDHEPCSKPRSSSMRIPERRLA